MARSPMPRWRPAAAPAAPRLAAVRAFAAAAATSAAIASVVSTTLPCCFSCRAFGFRLLGHRGVTPSSSPAAIARAAAGKGFGGVRKESPREKEVKEGSRVEDAARFWQEAQKAGDDISVEARRKLYKKARAAMGRTDKKRSLDYARICSNLGSMHLELDDRVKAAKRYQEALGVFEEVDGDGTECAACAANLARVRKELGELGEAEQNYRKAVKIYSTHLDTSYNEYLQVLKTFRLFYGQQGRINLAKELAEEEKRVQALAERLMSR